MTRQLAAVVRIDTHGEDLPWAKTGRFGNLVGARLPLRL
ncbi:hypothetical protein MPNT_10245 [Candidatus Methylacidithermus pantelleriae]|uniref:Uncharacterized protein n=1 Tax=Candidatus Methylacidithermus pantelleriae TaxID=2744239 RepID=A0A8J2BQR7_9BACT|nr:hypothetical protein MPNT_10245 [Candidatus Methylacidithermus pantelleriae]